MYFISTARHGRAGGLQPLVMFVTPDGIGAALGVHVTNDFLRGLTPAARRAENGSHRTEIRFDFTTLANASG